jgi:hypothetical protein
MKKLIALLLIGCFTLTPVLMPSISHAQFENPEPSDDGGYVGEYIASAAEKAAGNVIARIAGEASELLKSGVAWISYFALFTSGWLVGKAGELLDESIKFSVVTMSSKINNYPGIDYGWTLVRDLGNFIFIFALLYVAITTVLGMANTNTMKIVRNIVIVGLLVNFSLFFTKVLIDASNVLSLVFYEQFVTKQASSDTVALTGMTEKIAGYLKIQTVFTDDATKATGEILAKDWAGILTIGIGGTLFFLATALTFLWAAALFVARFLILALLLILSPVGFIGFMLPQTSGLAKKWWNRLIAQLTFAPVYMMLMALVFLLASGMESIYPLGEAGLAGALAAAGGQPLPAGAPPTGPGSTIGPIINFVVLIGFINAAAIVATAVATNSGGFAVGMRDRSMNWLKGSARWAGRGAARGTGRVVGGTINTVGGGVMRNTVGRMAYNKLERERGALEARIKKGDLKAKDELAGLEARASKEYDFRNIGLVKRTIGTSLGSAGTKGGYKGRYESAEKAMDEKINRKQPSILKRWEMRRELNAARNNVDNARSKYEKALAGKPIVDPETGKTNVELAEAELKKATKDLGRQERNRANEGRRAQVRYAAKVTQRKMRNTGAQRAAASAMVEKSRNAKLSDEEKLDASSDKIKAILDKVSGDTPITDEKDIKNLQKAVKDIPNNQITSLDEEFLKDTRVAQYLKTEQLKELAKAEKLDKKDAKKILAAIYSNTENPAYGYVEKGLGKGDSAWVKIADEVKKEAKESKSTDTSKTVGDRDDADSLGLSKGDDAESLGLNRQDEIDDAARKVENRGGFD